MALSLRGVTDNGAGSNATALTLNKVTGTLQGDLMIVMCNVDGTTTTNYSTTTWTLPTGWAQLDTAANAGIGGFVFYKVAGASEPASYTFTPSPTGQWIDGSLGCITGQDTTTQFDVTGSHAIGTSGVSCPSITTVTPNTLLLLLGGSWAGTGATLQTGFTNASGQTDGNAFSTKAQAAAGATGTASFNAGATPQVAFLLALRPLAANISSGTDTMGGSGAIDDGYPMGGSGAIDDGQQVGGGPDGLVGSSVAASSQDTLGGSGGLSASSAASSGSDSMGSPGSTGAIDSGTHLGGSAGLSATAIGPFNTPMGGSGGLRGYSQDGAPKAVMGSNAPQNMLSANQSDIETDVTPWLTGLNAGSISQDLTTHMQGNASLKVVTGGTGTFEFIEEHLPASSFVPGATYIFSLNILGLSAGGTLRFYCQADQNLPTNIRIGNANTITLTTGWVRQSFNVTMPLDILDRFSRIGVRLDTGGTAQALTFWVDALQIEPGTLLDPWQEGGTYTPSGLTASAIVGLPPVNSGMCLMGDFQTDGLAAIQSVASSNQVSLGNQPNSGLSPTQEVVASIALNVLLGGSTGISRGYVMGGSGGWIVSGISIINASAKMGSRASPSGGIAPLFPEIGWSNGQWVTVAVKIWRGHPPQWVYINVAVWRGGTTGWKQLTT